MFKSEFKKNKYFCFIFLSYIEKCSGRRATTSL